MKRAPALLACAGALLLVAACGDLKTASPAGNGSNGGGSSSSSSSSGSNGPDGDGTTTTTSSSSSGTGSSSGSTLSGGNGPGPHGSLPTGYCCTKDDECRDRHCADVGGQKMCLDGCRRPETCTGKGLPSGFACDAPTQYDDGWCQPPGGFTCLAASSFERGGKMTGACCTATGDGSNGLECEGGLCIWYTEKDLDPPFFCSNACSSGADCGPGFKCQLQIGQCVPGNEPFTCE